MQNEPNMSSASPTRRPPEATAIDAAGNIYVSDTDQERVIKITPEESPRRRAENAWRVFWRAPENRGEAARPGR